MSSLEQFEIRLRQLEEERRMLVAQVDHLSALLQFKESFFLELQAREKPLRRARDPQRLAQLRANQAYQRAFTEPQPLVSIIMPTYNCARLILERTLPSVLAQDYEHWELIIVGDAMDEEGCRLLRAISDPRVSFYNLKHRGRYPGHYGPRWCVAGTKPVNFGLRLARGEWITHLDDDDEFTPNHISALLHLAKEQQVEWAHGKVLFVPMPREPGQMTIIGEKQPSEGNISRISSLYHALLKNFRYNNACWQYGYPGDWDLWERFLEMDVTHAHLPAIVGIHHGLAAPRQLQDVHVAANASPMYEKKNPDSKSSQIGSDTGENEENYRVWLASHTYQERDAIWLAERMAQWSYTPRFHLAVLLSRDAEEQLAETINALADQFYDRWHLSVVAETPAPAEVAGLEVLTWFHAKDGLATLNEALCMQEADWVGVIHAGDRVAPHALFAFVETINRHPGWQLIYSDEDSLQDGMRQAPRFKPDFNPDLLRSMDYIGDLLLMRRDLFQDLGGFAPVMAEAARYDLMLRAYERLGVDGIGHIPDVLYHRAMQAQIDPVKNREVLRAHLNRCGENALVEPGLLPATHRVRYALRSSPWVTIIVLMRDHHDLLKTCIESALRESSYTDFDIVIVNNDSPDSETLRHFDQIKARYPDRVIVLPYPHSFNYAAQTNLAARNARGDYLLLLSNDVEITQSDWIQLMLSHAQRDEIGAVGVRLLFPDSTLQNAGMILGMGAFGVADFLAIGQNKASAGYMGRLQVEQNYSAISAACLLVQKDKYWRVQGLDESVPDLKYSGVDLCLKLMQEGYRNIWTPFVSLVYKSSVIKQNKNMGPDGWSQEVEILLDRWGDKLTCDFAHNRNLTLAVTDYSVETESGFTWDPEWRPRPRLLLHPADQSGCGEYRIVSPMRALARNGHVQGWISDYLLTPTELRRMKLDSVVLQRQVESHQLDSLKRYRRFGDAFLIYELDDLLTAVPVTNACRAGLPADIDNRLHEAISSCDRLVVSTAPLADAYGAWAEEVLVVPNFVEWATWGSLTAERRVSTKPRVGWAGSGTHLGDLVVMAKVVEILAGEVDWIFFGMCPKVLRPYVKEFHAPVAIRDYPARLAALSLDLAIAPLELNAFNEAKSHLRILEYGILGYPVVCTDIYPYQAAPVTRVRNRTQEWVDAIRMHLADPVASVAAGERLRTYVLQNWILEENLDKWVEAWLP